MSETLVRLRYFVVVCLISSYYLVCNYGVIIINCSVDGWTLKLFVCTCVANVSVTSTCKAL